MNSGRSTVKVSCYSTPAPLYTALCQVFSEDRNGGVKWVSFRADNGVELSFFAADDEPEASA
jgi:hypothetical protein